MIMISLKCIISSLGLIVRVARQNASFGSNGAKLFASQTFHEHVCCHLLCGTVFELDIRSRNLFTNKMMTDVNMFGTPMKLRVLAQSNGRLIVLVKYNCFGG